MYLDSCKAFDMVPHILISELGRDGFEGGLCGGRGFG